MLFALFNHNNTGSIIFKQRLE